MDDRCVDNRNDLWATDDSNETRCNLEKTIHVYRYIVLFVGFLALTGMAQAVVSVYILCIFNKRLVELKAELKTGSRFVIMLVTFIGANVYCGAHYEIECFEAYTLWSNAYLC